MQLHCSLNLFHIRLSDPRCTDWPVVRAEDSCRVSPDLQQWIGNGSYIRVTGVNRESSRGLQRSPEVKKCQQQSARVNGTACVAGCLAADESLSQLKMTCFEDIGIDNRKIGQARVAQGL